MGQRLPWRTPVIPGPGPPVDLSKSREKTLRPHTRVPPAGVDGCTVPSCPGGWGQGEGQAGRLFNLLQVLTVVASVRASMLLCPVTNSHTALYGKRLDLGLGSCSQNTVQRGCPHRSRPGAPRVTDHLSSASGPHRAAPSRGRTALKPSMQTGPVPSAARVLQGRPSSPASTPPKLHSHQGPTTGQELHVRAVPRTPQLFHAPLSHSTGPSAVPRAPQPSSLITTGLQDESPAPTAPTERNGHSL